MEAFEGAEALDVLADETRLAILRALAERVRESPADSAMQFAELRKAAGVRDSGNFSYHLGKLTGWLVEESEGGYQLSAPGVRAVSTLAAGAYGAHESLDPQPIDRPCPVCGEEMEATTSQGTFVVGCENDHTVGDFLTAGVGREHDLDEVLGHLARHGHQYIENVLGGFCALCDGPVERREFDLSPAGADHAFGFACQRCGAPYGVPPAAVAMVHPATTWFAYERGVDLREDPEFLVESITDPDAEQVGEDPPLYEVTLRVAADEVSFTIDDEPSVVAVSPSPDTDGE